MNKIVIPGEKIGAIEEYIGLNGTYEDSDGNIRSKYFGILSLNLEKHEALVTRIRKPVLIEVEDEVIGRIFNISGVFGYVKIEVKNGKPLDRSFIGILYPPQVVREIKNVYNVGDYILARVVSLKNRAVHLSIAGKKYGVIKAFCRACGSMLIKKIDGILKCHKCGNMERRKISIHYGKEWGEIYGY